MRETASLSRSPCICNSSLSCKTCFELTVYLPKGSFMLHIYVLPLFKCNILPLLHIHWSLRSITFLRQRACTHHVAKQTPHCVPGRPRGSFHLLLSFSQLPESPCLSTDVSDLLHENFISHFSTFLVLILLLVCFMYFQYFIWSSGPMNAYASKCSYLLVQTPQTLGVASNQRENLSTWALEGECMHWIWEL